jgi:hypothetical protein
MAKIQVLPQETITVGEDEYLITALGATDALVLQEELLESDFKLSNETLKKLICGTVSKDNKQITPASFDIIFARRTRHLNKLAQEVVKYNFEDVFTESGTDETE